MTEFTWVSWGTLTLFGWACLTVGWFLGYREANKDAKGPPKFVPFMSRETIDKLWHEKHG